MITLYTKDGAMVSIDADKLEAGLQSGNTFLKNLVEESKKYMDSMGLLEPKTAAPNPPAPNPTTPGSGAKKNRAPTQAAGKTSSATAGMTSNSHSTQRRKYEV